MSYGKLPTELGFFEIKPKEMFFYQYLPIKLVGEIQPTFEKRLKCFESIIGAVCCNFIGEYGLDKYKDSYIYLTAKNMYQQKNCGFNRNGWHSDGFLTQDINYIWSDSQPTVFNSTEFKITEDDLISIQEMEKQVDKTKNKIYPDNTLLRLNQYNIHKVGKVLKGMRCFLKISFSADKYDLMGNSHNYLLEYDWELQNRKEHRNIPQTKIK